MSKKINLTDVLDNCKIRLNGLMDDEKFNSFTSELEVRAYMPIREKRLFLMLFLIDIKYITYSENAYDDEIKIEVSSLFNILLRYTNINVVGYESYFTEDNYDLIYQSGLADYIFSTCERDYNKSIDMYKDMIRINDMLSVKLFIDEIGSKNITKNINSIKKMVDNLKNSDMTEAITNIASINDPILSSLREQSMKTADLTMKEEIK